jgi:hypothetical protein
LVAIGLLLPIAVAWVPVTSFQRHAAPLLVLAALANGLWLSLYAFGEDDYTSDGTNRWQTHNFTGSHLFYVVALLWELALATLATTSALRRWRQLLWVVAALAALTGPVLWFGSAFAFDNN